MNSKTLIWAGILSSIALAACAPSANKPSELQFTSGSIIGGREVEAGSTIQQSIVAVYNNFEGSICTGTLISENIVLTAAHCISDDTNQMFVIFDTQMRDTSSFAKVTGAEVSPGWASRQTLDKDTSDIALIYFKGVLPVGYKPAVLLNEKNRKYLKKGTWVTLAGYGISNGITHEGAGTLRTTEVQIEDPSYGTSEVTLNQKAGTGACHGDSGGPAFIKIKGVYYLWGVTSRGVNDDNDDCSQFAAYTNAVVYRKWIDRSGDKMIASNSVSTSSLIK